VVGDQDEPVAIRAVDGSVERLAQAGGSLRDRVEHRLHIGLRLADDAEDVAGGGLLIERLAEGALQVRIQRPWRAALKSVREGRTALLAELGAGSILVQAPRTLHTAPSQRIGAGNGWTGGESLCSQLRGVKKRTGDATDRVTEVT
jgi:hypothetical protein